MGVRLPPEYQEVDFLESTGTQYIVLPISNITKTDEFELVVQRLSNTYVSCFGYSANGKYYDINLRQGSSPYPTEIAWGNTGRYVRSTSELPTDRFHKIALRLNDSNKLVGSIDGNQMPGSITPSAASLDAPLRLFGRSGENYYAITRFKSFRYWRDSAVSCDMILCYRKSDNKPGMYDLVTKQFFVNQGSGDDFIVGPDVIDSISTLMVAWRRMLMRKVARKYLDFDGSFYFKSGYIPTKDTQIIVDFSCNNTSRNIPIFGSRAGTYKDSFYAWARVDRDRYLRIERFASSNSWTEISYNTTDGIYTIDTRRSVLFKNGYAVASWIYGGTIFNGSAYEIYIGGINNAGNLLLNLGFIGKLYRVQIIEGDLIVRDYLPNNDKLKDRITGQILEKYNI